MKAKAPQEAGTCALYLRVSTDEQTAENQRPALLKLARARGLRVVETYEETASAVGKRPEWKRCQEAARAGEWGALLIWSLDRLGRSLAGNLEAVLELDRLNVRVISHREPWLDSDGPTRGLLVAIFSWVAEQERSQLVARTKAGLATARAKGVRLGRPPRGVDLDRLCALMLERHPFTPPARTSRWTLSELAQKLHVTRSVVSRAVTKLKRAAALQEKTRSDAFWSGGSSVQTEKGLSGDNPQPGGIATLARTDRKRPVSVRAGRR